MIEVNGNKFLVTGGAGFIGSHICEELVKQGKQVICVDNGVVGTRENLVGWWDPKLCTFMDMDIINISTRELAGVDVVFHNAASKCTRCKESPWTDLMTNAWGSYQVFEAARKVGAKVVHASTGSVYGEITNEVRQVETGPYKPKSFYGVSKLAGESYLRAFAEYYPDFRYTILRYFHVYGPRQDDSAYGGVVPIFIRNGLTGKKLTIYGDGEQVRFFAWVKDIVNANFNAANKAEMDFEAYNVSGPVAVTINQLAMAVLFELGLKADAITYEPERSGDIRYFNPSTAKIRAERAAPETMLSEGLKETINWYREKHSLEDAV